MDYLNVNVLIESDKNFNWDDIECGNMTLDHSQNFFRRNHINHERLDDTEEIKVASKEIEINHNLGRLSDVENVEVINKELEIIHIKHEKLDDVKDIEVINQEMGRTLHLHKIDVKKHLSTASANTILEERDSAEDKENQTIASNIKDSPAGDREDVDLTLLPLPKNVVCQWSSRKNEALPLTSSTGAIPKIMKSHPPHAYEFKDFYQKKKEEALRRREEEERKMREFHSRPVPNFSAQHEQFERRKVLHAVTVPVTPKVLRKSREVLEKRKKKIEEWMRQQQPPKFESRPPSVLKEQPFVPKKIATVIEPRPFNLHSTRRLEERKLFDEDVQRKLEEKRKQVEEEEEERKKREDEHFKELRKLTAFKARPNPFK